MAKKHFVLAFWVGVVVLATIAGIQFFTSLNPVGFTFDNVQNYLGISINYNIPTTLSPFAYSPLTVVNAPTITCTFSTALLGLTNTGQTNTLSVATVDNSPVKTFSLASPQTGNSFKSFTVREMIYCPDVTNGAFPPNLVSGSLHLSWTATKKDGTAVTILDDSESIQPTVNGATLSLPSGTTPLVHVILYSWNVPTTQIESMLGVNPLGDDFTSLQNIAVTNTDTFYQGNVVSVPWTFTNIGPSLLSFTLHETTGNPLAINNLQMVLQVIDPANGQFNIQNNQIVTLQGTITNPGNTPINSPEVKLYYSDPSSTTQNTPIADFFVKPDPTTSSATSGTYTYTFKYPFSSTAQIGQYTFAMSLVGNPTVAKANVYLNSIAPPVCQPGYYVDAATFKCKISTTKTCANGSIISSDQQCPVANPPQGTNPCPTGQTLQNGVCTPSPNTCPANLMACLSGVNFAQIGASTTQNAFILGLIFLIILAVVLIGGSVYHNVDTKRGGSGVAPSQIINEE